ncbi:hypothetical protein PMAYCL1PPCAC_01610, partial [Pristionchus mayeri]
GSDGSFSVTGSSAEFAGDHFFIEIKIPCWGKQIHRCDSQAAMCKRSDCKYSVRYDIPRKYHYKTDEPVNPLHLDDFYIDEADASNRKSVCPRGTNC